jgi:uncharacterized protein YsxB (DUF464 family)
VIRILLSRNKNHQIDHYIIDGHAEESIACTGVSAIAQTTLLALKVLLKHHVTIQSADGYLDVRFIDAPTEKTNLLTETMLLGIREIEKTYQGALVVTDISRKI